MNGTALAAEAAISAGIGAGVERSLEIPFSSGNKYIDAALEIGLGSIAAFLGLKIGHDGASVAVFGGGVGFAMSAAWSAIF